MDDQSTLELNTFKHMMNDENCEIEKVVSFANKIGSSAYEELVINLFKGNKKGSNEILFNFPVMSTDPQVNNNDLLFGRYSSDTFCNIRIKTIIIKIGAPILEQLEKYLENITPESKGAYSIFQCIIEIIGDFGAPSIPLLKKIYHSSEQHSSSVIDACKKIGAPALDFVELISEDRNLYYAFRLQTIDLLIENGKTSIDQLIDISNSEGCDSEISSRLALIGRPCLEKALPFILALDGWKRREYGSFIDVSFDENFYINFLANSTPEQKIAFLSLLNYSIPGEKKVPIIKRLLLDGDKQVRLETIKSLMGERNNRYE